MKSENSENKQETRGRKPLENKSTQVSWRIPHLEYQLLIKEQKRQEELTGDKPELSRVFRGLVKKHLK